MLTLQTAPNIVLMAAYPIFVASFGEVEPPVFMICLSLGVMWPVVVSEVAWRVSPRMYPFAIALTLAACGAQPMRQAQPAPSIPTTASETWRCEAAGVVVRIVGAPLPDSVTILPPGAEETPAACVLVPLPRQR